MAIDDRTTSARIRDAAIAQIAAHGSEASSARRIAEAADVSPGLLMHHFGSMEGLRTACDEHVAAVIREHKQAAMSVGPGLDPLAALRESRTGPLVAYLARRLTDRSAAVTKLVDDLVTDAEQYCAQGVESGMLQPTRDPRGRAVVLTLWSLGALVLHEHVRRLLGVDLTDPDLGQHDDVLAYAGPAYEIFGAGVFTPEFAAQVRRRLKPGDARRSDAGLAT